MGITGSYVVGVKVFGEDTYHENNIRFRSYFEAEEYAKDLLSRWTLVEKFRIMLVEEDANYEWTASGRLKEIKA